MRLYSIFSHHKDQVIKFFDTNDKGAILSTIKEHLLENKTDTLELCKEYAPGNYKRYLGTEILKHYKVNPENDLPSLLYNKNGKRYFKVLK
jgi:hypothetical protein